MFNLFGFITPLFAASLTAPFEWLSSGFDSIIKSLVDSFTWLWIRVSEFLSIFWNNLKGTLTGLWDSLSSSLESICSWFFGVFESLSSWFSGAFDTGFEWLADTFNSCLDFFGHCIEYCWDGFWYCIYYLLEWVYENFLYLLDWFVEWMMSMIDYLLEQVPEIAMPAGFESAVPVFIKFAMILNEALPVKEAFSLFALYLLFLCALIIYRFIKTWIPFV